MNSRMITTAALVVTCLMQSVRADSAVTRIGFPSPAKASGSVAPKRGGDFVLIDGQVTRLPVMSCKMPDGCVALGKVIWNGSGATANFDPNSSAAFNNVKWGTVK